MRPGGWAPPTIVILGLLLVALPAVSAGADHAAEHTAASDHPDPGLSPSFALFPTHDEVMTSVQDHADHPWVTVHDLGDSHEGRAIKLLEITDPTSSVPIEDRVVTFIFTQQHGNEPAGTPAALQILEEITDGGPLAGTLSNQILLLLPMANPDGSEENQRHNAQDRDINRDHIGLETPEASVLHKILSRWDVHVAMDHHEYGGIGAGDPVPVRVYDHDLTTLYPRHGNVRAPTLAASKSLMYEGIWPPAEEAGYSANEYGEVTASGIPVDEIAGGPDPGIMRNHLGLHNIAGLLVETRVDSHPNPFHDAERRTDIHHVVMDATLRYAHEHAAFFIEAQRISHDEADQHPADKYVEGESTGQLAPAYRVDGQAEIEALFAQHALPAGLHEDGAIVYPVEHGLQGHAAALLHPASSRAVADDVTPVDQARQPLEQTSADDPSPEAVPSLAPLLVAGLLGLIALSRRP